MFFGNIVAIIGTALCTGAINGMQNCALFPCIKCRRLLLGIGGVAVGAIGLVSLYIEEAEHY